MEGLIFSSFRVEKDAMSCVLDAIERVELPGARVDCAFYDDNTSADATRMLQRYVSKHENWIILPRLENLPESKHAREGPTRGWTTSTVDRVIAIKNMALAYALEQGYAWVFLLDADLIIHPNLLKTLFFSDSEIVAGIFWTRFDESKPLLPNCWDIQPYRFRSADSLIRLREAGLYEVGGLGAATMIRREALKRGVQFSRIPSLDLWGEDKHFCIRAACLGLSLHVETTYPLFHMYRPADVEAGRRWFEGGCRPEEIRDLLDEEWEGAVRRMLRPAMRAPEGSLRRKAASALRLTANWLDPK